MLALGFGKTEIDAAYRIMGECYAAIGDTPESPEEALRRVQQRYSADGKRYKKMSRDEAPERYSYFWATCNDIGSGKYIVEFCIHHINRRHALSPDGWAMITTDWILSVSPEDGARIYRCEDTLPKGEPVKGGDDDPTQDD